ncbi:CpsD/CapB family tyrosine-protein kinase [Enterococcus casseliflavus]|uniref:CpsD/CapB family tyrosine-protein kinase n=1 Tax=Enterococcus casseliflavus TaxID=37734 RepID=UPI000354595A|nr:CpsD/CapB family tyrosine-protein kinase [Enterococcus casseliflavus]EPH63742.1 capsular exopolysaccharide family protein [Enterococcus casseliflavus 14-MB-W-14]MBN2904489.1 CpsD/CapB family tyrosine-protein kinase [Enterococcus sp.]
MRSMKENYSIISEQVKLIRENVEYLCQQQEAQTILITSGESGTGKSTVSANLAVAYAQKGNRTLLIDADLRKPTQHYLFSQEMHVGLSNYIRRDISIESCVQQVILEDCEFSIITSGAIMPNPNDLLASSKMTAALQSVKQLYDVIIIDTPPVNVVSDALILAKKVDGVLLVVHAEKTNKQSAKNAVKKLRLVNANILGVVANGTTDTAVNYYY